MPPKCTDNQFLYKGACEPAVTNWTNCKLQDKTESCASFRVDANLGDKQLCCGSWVGVNTYPQKSTQDCPFINFSALFKDFGGR